MDDAWNLNYLLVMSSVHKINWLRIRTTGSSHCTCLNTGPQARKSDNADPKRGMSPTWYTLPYDRLVLPYIAQPFPSACRGTCKLNSNSDSGSNQKWNGDQDWAEIVDEFTETLLEKQSTAPMALPPGLGAELRQLMEMTLMCLVMYGKAGLKKQNYAL